MGCCGEKRAELRANATASWIHPETRVGPLRTHEPEPHAATGVAVEYRGVQPVLLRGPASGRVYTFSAARRVRKLAARDAVRLVRNPLFRLAHLDDEEGRSNGTAEESDRGASAGSR